MSEIVNGGAWRVCEEHLLRFGWFCSASHLVVDLHTLPGAKLPPPARGNVAPYHRGKR